MTAKCPCCHKEVEFLGKEILANREATKCPKCKMYVPVKQLINQLERETVKQPEQIIEDLPAVVLQKDVTYSAGIEKFGYPGAYPLYKKCICQNPACGKEFQSKRSDAKTCSTRCRVAAARSTKPNLKKELEIYKHIAISLHPSRKELAAAVGISEDIAEHYINDVFSQRCDAVHSKRG